MDDSEAGARRWTMLEPREEAPMTPPSASTTPAFVTLAEWDSDWSQREETYELVDGIPVLVPPESYDNRYAVMRLASIIDRALRGQVILITEGALQLASPGERIRVPDLTVLRRPLPGLRRAGPEELLLVAEIVSDASEDTDWGPKRTEYGAGAIPLYLVIDVRPGHRRIAMFSDPTDGTYPETDRDREEVTVPLLGEHIRVHLDDLTW